jgi:hypothetical protein
METKHYYLSPEDPYFNVKSNSMRFSGEITSNYNVMIHCSRFSDIAIYKQDRNHKNPYGFIQQVVNW